MRIIKQFTILIIAIVWFLVVIPYFLIQTAVGTDYALTYLFKNNSYTITAETISNSFNKPYEITFNDIRITEKNTNNTILQAKKVTLALPNDNLFQLNHFDYIVIQHGEINLTTSTNHTEQAITANLLQLINVSVKSEVDGGFSAKNVTGGVQPWTSESLLSEETSRFNFTAEAFTFNKLNIQALVLTGFQKNNALYLHNIGGNIGSGFFTGKAKRQQDNSWFIDEIQVNHINLQSSLPLSEIQQIPQTWPAFSIRYLSLIDSSVSLPEIKIEKGNLEIRDINYRNGWDLSQLGLAFTAESVLWQDELLTNPILELSTIENQMTIQKAITRWQKGLINTYGTWQNNHLTLDSLLISGINYQLPEQWKNIVHTTTLPPFLSEITIKNISVAPSTIVDINPDFPMQFTGFEVYGKNVQVGSQQQLGLWQGQLEIKSAHSTINTVTLKHAALSTNADIPSSAQQNKIVENTFSALTSTGIIEGKMSIEPTTSKIIDLDISGYSTDSNLLSHWKILDNPVPADNFSLIVTGQWQPLQLNGTLQIKTINNIASYPIKQNRITRE